jgi:murein DD-endopeptidase MepM/ murein hydrolase activator NlpD
VKWSEVVGTVGKSGNATGFHLHYEIRRNGRAIDPRPYL